MFNARYYMTGVVQGNTHSFSRAMQTATDDAAVALLRMKNMANDFLLIGSGMLLGFSMPMIALGRAMKNAHRDIEVTMKKLGAAASLSDSQLGELEKSFQRIGEVAGELPGEVAKAGYEAAQAMYTNVEDIKKIAKEAAMLRVASGFEVPTEVAANQMTRMTQAMGISTDQLREMNDVLMQTYYVGKMSISDIVNNMGKAAGVFGLVYRDKGMQAYKDLLELMADASYFISADQAATGLRNTMSRVATPTGKAAAYMTELANSFGYATTQEMAYAKGMPFVMREIGKRAGGDLKMLRERYGFEKRELTVVGSLLARNGELSGKVREGLSEYAGTFDDAFSRNKATLKYIEERFKSIRDTFLMTFGKDLAFYIEHFANALNGLMKAFTHLPKFVRHFLILGTILTILANAVLLLIGALKSLNLFLVSTKVTEFFTAKGFSGLFNKRIGAVSRFSPTIGRGYVPEGRVNGNRLRRIASRAVGSVGTARWLDQIAFWLSYGIVAGISKLSYGRGQTFIRAARGVGRVVLPGYGTMAVSRKAVSSAVTGRQSMSAFAIGTLIGRLEHFLFGFSASTKSFSAVTTRMFRSASVFFLRTMPHAIMMATPFLVLLLKLAVLLGVILPAMLAFMKGIQVMISVLWSRVKNPEGMAKEVAGKRMSRWDTDLGKKFTEENKRIYDSLQNEQTAYADSWKQFQFSVINVLFSALSGIGVAATTVIAVVQTVINAFNTYLWSSWMLIKGLDSLVTKSGKGLLKGLKAESAWEKYLFARTFYGKDKSEDAKQKMERAWDEFKSVFMDEMPDVFKDTAAGIKDAFSGLLDIWSTRGEAKDRIESFYDALIERFRKRIWPPTDTRPKKKAEDPAFPGPVNPFWGGNMAPATTLGMVEDWNATLDSNMQLVDIAKNIADRMKQHHEEKMEVDRRNAESNKKTSDAIDRWLKENQGDDGDVAVLA